MKTHGAMMGVAIGDALGGPVEFMHQQEIKAKYGTHTELTGGGWLNLEPGETTDDTAMTLAVARGIRKNPDNPIPEIGREFYDWYASRPKDIGVTCCNSILQARINGWDWRAAAEYTRIHSGNRSAGNGALMRCIYPGIFYHNDLQAAQVTMEQAKMTHYDDQSTLACIIYCRIIREFLNTPAFCPKYCAKAIIKKITAGTVYEQAGELPEDDVVNPGGFVVETMKAAIWAFWNGYSFEDCLVRAVNLGGDADTVGAITGGMAGAWYGLQGIPDRWKEGLDSKIKDEILDHSKEAVFNRKQERLVTR